MCRVNTLKKNLHDFISTPTNLSNVCNRRSQFVRARQRSRDTHRKYLLEAEARAGEEGRAEEQLTVGALAQDQRSSLPSWYALPHRRHDVLLRLWTHATSAAHSSGGKILQWLWNSGEFSSAGAYQLWSALRVIIYDVLYNQLFNHISQTNLTHLWKYMRNMYQVRFSLVMSWHKLDYKL